MLQIIGQDNRGKVHIFAQGTNYKVLKRQAKQLAKQNTNGLLTFTIVER